MEGLDYVSYTGKLCAYLGNGDMLWVSDTVFHARLASLGIPLNERGNPDWVGKMSRGEAAKIYEQAEDPTMWDTTMEGVEIEHNDAYIAKYDPNIWGGDGMAAFDAPGRGY